MMKNLALLLSFFGLVSLTSCGLKPVTPNKVTDVKFGKIDILKGTVTMDMGLQIDNPNNFAITLHELELAVKVADVNLGTVCVEDKVRIEKDTEMVYRVNVNAKLTDLINGIPTLLSAISSKQANTEVSGWIKVGMFGLKKKFPVSLKQEAVETGEKK